MKTQERIAEALNNMPSFYEDEFADWKALLAKRIERFGWTAWGEGFQAGILAVGGGEDILPTGPPPLWDTDKFDSCIEALAK